MDGKPRLIAGPFGQLLRKKNGLIYFYMPQDRKTVFNKQSVLTFLEIVHRLDDSGSARIIVIQNGCQEPTFEGQFLLVNSKLIAGLACMAATNAQGLSADRFVGFVKSHSPNFPIRVFRLIEKAENWLLNSGSHFHFETSIHSRENILAKPNDV